ncbi:MAG: hypothetical protein E3J72_05535 [Planctomycetota bacterium]|nr:MAG: hypothetical protein E3J72_05535 [Planctomycetota bacterium]
MPVGFESKSHGMIAFGFFNIESDMLLLERNFFFADEFCKVMGSLGEKGSNGKSAVTIKGCFIESTEDVGDLMGAIAGKIFTGFIGDTYEKYPFPQKEKDFKQNPNGYKTQAEFKEMISKYAQEKKIPLTVDEVKKEISIGDYTFTLEWFQELIKYVWLGGMPRWKDAKPPGYVLQMKDALEKSGHWLFAGLEL